MIEYRPILGFPDYIISNQGTVISVRMGQFRMMKDDVCPKGYYRIKLLRGEKESFGFFIHKLVLATFVGPCPEGMQTRHLDGNPANNRISNLAWGTAKENQLDRVRHGSQILPRVRRGSENNKARLTEENVREIVRSEMLGIELAKRFAVTPTAISGVRRGLTWRHVTGFQNPNS